MAAIVTARYLGNPDTEKQLTECIRELMAEYLGEWRVEVLGAARNTIWEMTVVAPNGIKQWVRRLYGEDGGHGVENILADLQNIVEQSPVDKESAAHIA